MLEIEVRVLCIVEQMLYHRTTVQAYSGCLIYSLYILTSKKQVETSVSLSPVSVSLSFSVSLFFPCLGLSLSLSPSVFLSLIPFYAKNIILL